MRTLDKNAYQLVDRRKSTTPNIEFMLGVHGYEWAVWTYDHEKQYHFHTSVFSDEDRARAEFKRRL